MEIVQRYLENVLLQTKQEEQDVNDLINSVPSFVDGLIENHTQRIVELVLSQYKRDEAHPDNPNIFNDNEEWLEDTVRTHVRNISQLDISKYYDKTQTNTKVNAFFMQNSNVLQMTLLGAPETVYELNRTAATQVQGLINEVNRCISVASYYLSSIKTRIVTLPETIGRDSKEILQNTASELLKILQNEVERNLSSLAYTGRLDGLRQGLDDALDVLTNHYEESNIGTIIKHAEYLERAMKQCVINLSNKIQILLDTGKDIIKEATRLSNYLDPIIVSVLNYILSQKRQLEEQLQLVINKDYSYSSVIQRGISMLEIPVLNVMAGYFSGAMGKTLFSDSNPLLTAFQTKESVVSSLLSGKLSPTSLQTLGDQFTNVSSKISNALAGGKDLSVLGDIDVLSENLGEFSEAFETLDNALETYSTDIASALASLSPLSMSFANNMTGLVGAINMDKLTETLMTGALSSLQKLQLDDFSFIASSLKEINKIIATETDPTKIVAMQRIVVDLNTINRANTMASALRTNVKPELLAESAEMYDKRKETFAKSIANIV